MKQAIRVSASIAAILPLLVVTADAADKVRFQTDWLPSGEHARLKTSPECWSVARRILRIWARLESHNLIWPGLFQSPSPEINVVASGVKATDHTSLSCPLKLRHRPPCGGTGDGSLSCRCR